MTSKTSSLSKPDSFKSVEADDRRLWIGNLDPRVTEYQLLKLVRTFGEIEKFDLMFHRSGPLTGQPRGFAFVTYKQKSEALNAQKELQGKVVGSKILSVKWAQCTTNEDVSKAKPELEISVLTGVATKNDKVSKKTAIQSIEAKLKMMESGEASDDFIINKLAAAEAPILPQYQSKQPPTHTKDKHRRNRRNPYHKKR